MNIEALFLDIDGTLVSMSTHHIPQSTIQALRLAKANGVKIFIATGRPTSLITNIKEIQQHDLIDGYITMNGAACIVQGNTILRNTLPSEVVDCILDFCKSKGISCPIITENESYIFQPTPIFEDIFYSQLNISPLDEWCVNTKDRPQVYQVCPFITAEQEPQLKELLSVDCEFNRWHPTFVDVAAQGSLKSRGIDQMAKHFGFSIEQTMAIGDGGNDISMLKHAHIGVAMGNAVEPVKAVADYITTHIDEDGIFNALKHFGVI